MDYMQNPVLDDGFQHYLPFIALTFISKFNMDILQYKSLDKVKKKVFKAIITNKNPEIIIFNKGYLTEEYINEDEIVFTMKDGKKFILREVETNYIIRSMQIEYDGEFYNLNTKFDEIEIIKNIKIKELFFDILVGGNFIIRKELAQIEFYFEKNDNAKGCFKFSNSSARYLYEEANENKIIRDFIDRQFKFLK